MTAGFCSKVITNRWIGLRHQRNTMARVNTFWLLEEQFVSKDSILLAADKASERLPRLVS
jgi:hypothetical protein